MSPDPAATSENENNTEGRSNFQVIRWVAAVLIGLAAAAYYLHGIDNQTVCREVAEEGQILKLCGPPGPSELIPFALVITLLLLPDLSELAIPGLLSLKRTVTQQKGRQDQLETKLAQVEQRVDQRVSFKIDLHTAEKEVEVKEETLLEAEGTAFEAADEETEAEPVPGPDVEADAAQAAPGERTEAELPPGLTSDEDDLLASLTMQLAWLTKNLTQYEAISRMRRVDQSERMATLTEEQQQVVDRWYNVFEDEIGLVKKFRNALAHNPYAVDLAELTEAVRIGRRLMRILLNGLGLSTAAIDKFPDP